MAKKPAKGKNIVLLSDGTGNSAAKIWKTNVWRLYKALDLTDGTQVAYYDDGVGTSSFKPLAILGGGLGYGLKRNIIHLYMFLCRHYKPGDAIYGFGFSRGAFTIRLLTGLVLTEGLVPYRNCESELKRNAKNAYRSYRRRTTTNWVVNFLVTLLRGLRDLAIAAWYTLRKYELYSELKKSNKKVGSIQFLGLWDTVDAYGLPMDEMTRGVDLWIWPLYFGDQNLKPGINRACHAISLDDERTTFHPVLWNERNEKRVFPGNWVDKNTEKPITNVAQERVSQVWFVGVHSNVGGGYPDDSLSHVPLKWMMEEAHANGLQFNPLEQQQILDLVNARGPIHDSRHGVSRYYRYGPRKIELLCDDTIDPKAEVRIEWPKIHESVFKRIQTRPSGYAPIVLPKQYAVVMENGDIRAGPYQGLKLQVPANPYEHGTQSESRANEQEKPWNAVWHRRLTYFIAVFATAYLAFFPAIHGDGTGTFAQAVGHFVEPIKTYVWPYIDPGFRFVIGAIVWAWTTVTTYMPFIGSAVTKIVEVAIDAIRAFVPGSGFAKPWLDEFRKHPHWFAFGALLILLCVARGSQLRARIFDRMRKIWQAIVDAGPKQQPIKPPPGDWLCRLRNSDGYQYALEYTKWYLLPTVFAFTFFYLVIVFVWHIGDFFRMAGFW